MAKGKQLFYRGTQTSDWQVLCPSHTFVPGHCKIPGNKKADELAARGNANLSSEMEVIIRDFESSQDVLADGGAFAFCSRRHIEVGARILYDHCVSWGMMPHPAGKTVAMYSGRPVVDRA